MHAYLNGLLGEKLPDFLNAEKEKTAIRVNTLKTGKEAFEIKLKTWQVEYSPHPANPTGLILSEDTLPLSHTLAFFNGEFVYQGVASQLPVLALDPRPGETILDIAAAPGSKSTQIAALMKNSGRLVLNEPSLNRLRTLTANSLRAGVVNDVLIRFPGQRLGQLFPEYFDRVLVDTPCTALGTYAAQTNEINKWWSFNKLEKLVNVQYHLLVSAIKAAKVNGVIVYSTCSIAPEENEQLVQRILSEYPVQIEPIPRWQGLALQSGMTRYQEQVFHPDLQKAVHTDPLQQPIEGFFIVRLRKIASLKIRGDSKKMKYKSTLSAQDKPVADLLNHLQQRWGIDSNYLSQFNFVMGSKRIWMVNPEWEKIPAQSFIKAGIMLAEKRYQEWKLTNSSVQFLNKEIKKGLLEIDARQLKQLFRQGAMEFNNYPPGYYVLNFQGENIASVSLFNGVLKIRLPHKFELVLEENR